MVFPSRLIEQKSYFSAASFLVLFAALATLWLWHELNLQETTYWHSLSPSGRNHGTGLGDMIAPIAKMRHVLALQALFLTLLSYVFFRIKADSKGFTVSTGEGLRFIVFVITALVFLVVAFVQV